MRLAGRALAATGLAILVSGLAVPPASAADETIGGTVTDSESGDPLVGIEITATNESDEEFTAETDSDGNYALNVTPNLYSLAYEDPDGFYLGSYDSTEVATDENVTVDATMELGGVVEGRIIEADTGDPAEGACVLAYYEDLGQLLGSGCADATGALRLTGLPVGEATLGIHAWVNDDYEEQWFGGTDRDNADVVEIKAGETTAIGEWEIVHGGDVTGQVTSPDGEPVAGAWVGLTHMGCSRAGCGEGIHTAQTDVDGMYTIFNVPSGAQVFSVAPPLGSGYARMWHGGSAVPSEASPVDVPSGGTVTVDFELVPEAKITILSEPREDGLNFDVHTADDQWIMDGWLPAGSTETEIGGLPTSTVKLKMWTGDFFDATWYFNGDSFDAANGIQVISGETTTINLDVAPASDDDDSSTGNDDDSSTPDSSGDDDSSTPDSSGDSDDSTSTSDNSAGDDDSTSDTKATASAGDDTGPLASTGASPLVGVLIALLLLLSGAGLVVVARRRRTAG